MVNKTRAKSNRYSFARVTRDVPIVNKNQRIKNICNCKFEVRRISTVRVACISTFEGINIFQFEREKRKLFATILLQRFRTNCTNKHGAMYIGKDLCIVSWTRIYKYIYIVIFLNSILNYLIRGENINILFELSSCYFVIHAQQTRSFRTRRNKWLCFLRSLNVTLRY